MRVGGVRRGGVRVAFRGGGGGLVEVGVGGFRPFAFPFPFSPFFPPVPFGIAKKHFFRKVLVVGVGGVGGSGAFAGFGGGGVVLVSFLFPSHMLS